MIETGLIGYGLAGSAFHAPLIDALPRLKLAGIATSRHDLVAASWPGVPVTDADALIADPRIDLIVIATPNTSHAPLARAALAAGKHVVVDKPLAIDASEGEALVELARSSGRMLTVFHNRRWDGDFLTIRRLLGEGRLGEVRLFESRWDRFRPAIKPGWREVAGEGTGLLADLGPHLVDQALQLFGLPDALSADIACQRDAARVDDYFELTLFYGGLRVILSASTLVAAPRPRFHVAGTAGSWVKRGIDGQEDWLRAGRRPNDPGYGIEPAERAGTLTDAAGGAVAVDSEPGDYRRFYAGVAAAILDGAPPVDPADACTGLRLIELARRSSSEGRRFDVAL